MSSSAPSSGAGSVSSRAERRCRRASMACIGVLSQTRAMLTLSEACERNKDPILEVLRSELAEQLGPLAERIRLEGTSNLRAPIALDAREHPWRVAPVDAVFSANTLHIMAWSAVREFVRGVGGCLAAPGVLCVYGPFRFRGQHTSDSNAEFDGWLRVRDPDSGIRDFEALEELTRAQGLVCSADHAMPANNRTLVWRRLPAAA